MKKIEGSGKMQFGAERFIMSGMRGRKMRINNASYGNFKID